MSITVLKLSSKPANSWCATLLKRVRSLEERTFLFVCGMAFITPKFLVDVKNLDGMNDLRFDPQAGLTIGAAVNMNRVIASPDVQAHYPLLAEACRSVASYQLRTRATIVGNICNASPAGDTIGACLVLGGVLNIHGLNNSCQEPLAAFFLGPGKTTLKPGDIVTAIHFPLPPNGCSGNISQVGT